MYVITTFNVVDSVNGSFATGNRKRIMLRLGTRVVMDDSFLIHKYGLTLLRSDEIKRPRFDPARLVGICFVFVVWFALSYCSFTFI